MGTGSSTKKVNKQIQVPSATHRRTRTPSPEILTTIESYSRRPYSSQPSPWLKKSNVHRQHSNEQRQYSNVHRQQSTSNLAQYASIWEQNGKLSSTFEQLIRTEAKKIEHDQHETHNQHLVTKHSSAFGAAQVESILISDIQTIHNLSTSERLDTLMMNLKQTHVDFDESVQRRIGQVTSQTESILAQVVEETQTSQQELLVNAKEQQTIHEEQYKILLEEFIAELDEKRAKQLAIIQEQLQEQRLEIFNESQLKIRAISEQANSVKNQIMVEEERKASVKIDSIVTEINVISTESAIHSLGAEITTKIDLTVHEKVGSNVSGQHLHFLSGDHRTNSGSKQQVSKRTTFIPNDPTNDKTSGRPTSSRLSDHQTKSISKIAKQNPANPKIKSQQS